ncbi:hypothetical protein B5X24_HaOG215770 [Helicoverpa armigera]|uniref:Reverse transcriptase domain-containing protein n=1 Tax=Helicoverpa armigera TaxID=29058 RepID=A0A2W1BAQ4_HELAM|nr:hypothetical protein B5X24_HaOG215770 [Helicoverpa armigera]
MVLLSASVFGVKRLLAICEAYAKQHGLKYNSLKSEIMVFEARRNGTCEVFPNNIVLNGTALRMVFKKYLGHVLTPDLRDNDDIERERRALAVRANMIARRKKERK